MSVISLIVLENNMTETILKLNTELFRISGILTLILYLLETLKEGYVSFFINPVIFLLIFLISGIIWLFTPYSDRIQIWK